MAILFVKLGKLIEIIIIDAVAAFDRVEFLTSGSEVKTLFRPHVSATFSFTPHILANSAFASFLALTSVFIAKGGFQLSGGIIFTIP